MPSYKLMYMRAKKRTHLCACVEVDMCVCVCAFDLLETCTHTTHTPSLAALPAPLLHPLPAASASTHAHSAPRLPPAPPQIQPQTPQGPTKTYSREVNRPESPPPIPTDPPPPPTDPPLRLEVGLLARVRGHILVRFGCLPPPASTPLHLWCWGEFSDHGTRRAPPSFCHLLIKKRKKT